MTQIPPISPEVDALLRAYGGRKFISVEDLQEFSKIWMITQAQLKDTIAIGDKFLIAGEPWEVIGLKPGGKVEMFNRAKSLFTDRWHKNVINFERVSK